MAPNINGTVAQGETATLKLVLAIRESAYYDSGLDLRPRVQTYYMNEIDSLRHAGDSSATVLWQMDHTQVTELATTALPWLQSATQHDADDDEHNARVVATAIMINTFDFVDIGSNTENDTLRMRILALTMVNNQKDGKHWNLWANDKKQIVSAKGDIDWGYPVALRAALLRGCKYINKNQNIDLTRDGIAKLTMKVKQAKTKTTKKKNQKSSAVASASAANAAGVSGNGNGDDDGDDVDGDDDNIDVDDDDEIDDDEIDKPKKKGKKKKKSSAAGGSGNGDDDDDDGDDDDDVDDVEIDDATRKAMNKAISKAVSKAVRRNKRKRRERDDDDSDEDSDGFGYDDFRNAVATKSVHARLEKVFTAYVIATGSASTTTLDTDDFIGRLKLHEESQASLGLAAHTPPAFLTHIALLAGRSPVDAYSQKILKDIVDTRERFKNAATAFDTHHSTGIESVSCQIARQRCYAAVIDVTQHLLPHIKQVAHLNVFATTQDIIDYLRTHPYTKGIIDPCDLGGTGSARSYLNALAKASAAVLSGKKKQLTAIKTMQGLVERLAKATNVVAALGGRKDRGPKRKKQKSKATRPSGTSQWCTKCESRGANAAVCSSHNDAGCDADHAARIARRGARS